MDSLDRLEKLLESYHDLVKSQKKEIEKLQYDLQIADAAYDEVTEKYSELVFDTNYEIDKLENQLHSLKPFRDLVYHIASKRYENVDDYIRLAKQAIADYESVLST